MVERPPTSRILLASEGREIPARAVDAALRMARAGGSTVHVFSVARVWGTSLGLPNPGLLPTKREWDEQRAIVDSAVRALEQAGVDARGHVLATRAATKRIVTEAKRLNCDAIVMGADPPRNRFLADLMWSQEPYRVQRRAEIPVYLVTEDGAEMNDPILKRARGCRVLRGMTDVLPRRRTTIES